MSWAELLAAAEAVRTAAAANGEGRLADLRITGVGWATVEADRAFEELATVLDGPAAWVRQERDSLLGAGAWRRDPSPARGVGLFVLEPDTEGRLAACLARFGEGVAAVYLSPGGEADRIVPVNPRWGPYVIVRSRSG
jgi:hypothetical protein